MRSLFRPGLLLVVLALGPSAAAQGEPEPPGPGIRFNGLGRSYIQQTDLGGNVIDNDTLTVDRLTDGNFVLDLAVAAQPNAVTEVQGVIRLRNEFGGFFGAGSTVEIRELWARGIIADRVRYRLGDYNYRLTPFTVHLPERDGTVNEPELFRSQREVIDYEEFYTGLDERRFQGGTVDFGLAFDQVLETLDAEVFLARLRATDFRTTPTRLIGGGRLAAATPVLGDVGSRATVGVNLASTWDDLESGDATRGIRNRVWTIDADVTLLDRDGLTLQAMGEGGWSHVELTERVPDPDDGQPAPEVDPLVEDDDTFFEAGLAVSLATSGIGVSARFVDVGPDFYSAAAQSKRVDYTRSLRSFNRVGSNRQFRAVSLFDLTRDQGLYTSRVANQLMAYDPRYGNVLPYGRATPNRRGVHLASTYAPAEGPLDAGLEIALLTEIRGQGTDELKDFVLIRGEADVPLASLVGSSRLLAATLGLQYESTSRGGDPIVEVNLTSLLVELGLAVEVYDRLDVLLGSKTRSSSGRDFVPVLADFNDVRDFPGPFVTDDRESLVGAGLRYRFKDDVYLTVQVQQFSYGADASPDDDYRLGQVFALYSMTF
ncbi:hypothetical protein [Rubrivirga sp. IMCC45206]|uniref:hypothetical protein n=1 Tax=Rubrivirga sp. IMCC45206 TaxID=3391614 RepID=UPI0039903973